MGKKRDGDHGGSTMGMVACERACERAGGTLACPRDRAEMNLYKKWTRGGDNRLYIGASAGRAEDSSVGRGEAKTVLDNAERLVAAALRPPAG